MVMRSTEIGDRVSQALENDERTRESTIDVVNNLGVVTLRGVVPSPEVQRAAKEIARQQQGVITVINELLVG